MSVEEESWAPLLSGVTVVSTTAELATGGQSLCLPLFAFLSSVGNGKSN